MASLQSMCAVLLHVFLISFFSLLIADAAGHRKISLHKLHPPTRSLMGSFPHTLHYSSTPTFYNAFDHPDFIHANHAFDNNPDLITANHATPDTNLNVNTKTPFPNTENPSFYHKDISTNDDFKSSLNPNNDASFNPTYNNNYDHLPVSTNEYKDSSGVQYSWFSAPSAASSPSLYGRKFPASFESSFPNQQIYGRQSSPSSEQESNMYSSPSEEKLPATFESAFPKKQIYGKQSSASSEEESMYSSPSEHDKFPATFESAFPKKQSYGKQSSASSEQESLNTSPAEEKSLYRSSSDEKGMYTSSPSTQKTYYSSPSNYEGNYPFSSASVSNYKSPSTSEVDEPKNSQPFSNYDSFFNTPTIHSNVVHGSSPLGHPAFPLSDHDLTYGQVQVP